jgi:hypothetical protein
MDMFGKVISEHEEQSIDAKIVQISWQNYLTFAFLIVRLKSYEPKLMAG